VTPATCGTDVTNTAPQRRMKVLRRTNIMKILSRRVVETGSLPRRPRFGIRERMRCTLRSMTVDCQTHIELELPPEGEPRAHVERRQSHTLIHRVRCAQKPCNGIRPIAPSYGPMVTRNRRSCSRYSNSLPDTRPSVRWRSSSSQPRCGGAIACAEEALTARFVRARTRDDRMRAQACRQFRDPSAACRCTRSRSVPPAPCMSRARYRRPPGSRPLAC